MSALDARRCRMFVAWDVDDPTGDGAAMPVPASSHEEAARRFAAQREAARGVLFYQRIGVRVGFGDARTIVVDPGMDDKPRVTL